MPCHFEILPERRFIIASFEGDTSAHDITSGMLELWDDPLHSEDFAGLVDFTKAHVMVSPREIEYLSNFMLTHSQRDPSPWAVVVDTPKTTALAMLCRQSMSPFAPFAIFCTQDAAFSFLGHPDLVKYHRTHGLGVAMSLHPHGGY